MLVFAALHESGSWPRAEMTAARRSVRFLVSTRRRRARSAATVFDPEPKSV
jgi:hypothetical protein